MKSTVELKDNHITTSLELPNGVYNITLSKRVDDKTTEQLRKLWATIDDISIKQNGDRSQRDQIYMSILSDSGIRTHRLIVPTSSLQDLRKTVRFLSVISQEVINHTDMSLIDVCMVGVSDMDKREMAQVIDTCIKYAIEVGVKPQIRKEQYD